MEQLQKKVYTKAELAEVLGINPKDSHFKRNVENTLKKWGYEYEFPPYSKTITITYVPEGENKLAELLIRDYGIDVQVDAAEFACFLHAFNAIDGFASMPWGERQGAMKDVYGVDVCDKTLRNWANKLFSSGTLMKSNEKTYWKSIKVSATETLREPVEKSEFIEFYKYRREQQCIKIAEKIMGGRTDDDKVRQESWTEAHFSAMKKFGGWCYFSCKTILLSAFDDKDLTEIFELVDDIASCFVEFKRQEDAKLEEIRAQARAKVQADIANNNVCAEDFYKTFYNKN